jgi:phenylalanyl-tRNA synthetase beta chain
LGKVFNEEKNRLYENLALAMGLCGELGEDWQRRNRASFSLYDLKGYFERFLSSFGIENAEFGINNLPLFEPGSAFSIEINGRPIGVMGKVSCEILDNYSIKAKEVYLLQVLIKDIISFFKEDKIFKPYSIYPSIRRDISLLVKKGIKYSQIKEVILSFGKDAVSNIKLLEEYSGEGIPEGFKSFLVSVEYSLFDRTLKDEEVDILHKKIIEMLIEKLGIRLR